jgi:hypothetical protein
MKAPIVCPSCRSPNRAENQFCGKCGTALGEAKVAAARRREANRRFWRWALLLFVVVCVCWLLLRVLVENGENGKSAQATATLEQERPATPVTVATATAIPAPTDTPMPTDIRGPTGTPRPTDTPRPTVSPTQRLQAAIRKALGDGNRNVPRVDEIALEDREIFVFWAINSNLTEGLIRNGARRDVVAILKAVAESGVEYSLVHTAGSFSMMDVYGNEREQVVVSLTYTQGTVDKINWVNFEPDNIYVIADEVLILHPEFTP